MIEYSTSPKRSAQSRHSHHLTLLSLAQEAKSNRHFIRAESLYRRIAQEIHNTLGAGHVEFAIALYNVAQVLEAQQREQEATTLREQAREILVTQQESSSAQNDDLASSY